MLEVEERGVVYDASAQPPEGRIAYFTSLCPLASGSILCGFQVGPRKHAVTSRIGLCRSADGGRSWRQMNVSVETTIGGSPGSLSGPEIVEVEPGKQLMFTTWFDRSDPARPLFDPVTEGILHGKQLYAFSTDEGETWGPWQELITPGLTGRATTGPITRWPDGTIAYAFESFRDYDDPVPAYHAAWLVTSRDGGQTFSRPLLLAQDPRHIVYYWDQRLCPSGPAGEFVALFWTHDLRQKKDLSVHLQKGNVHDPELHKSAIHPTPIPGQIAAPLLLDDGRLLAFVVDRARPGTMKLWSSPDGGGAWPERDCLTVHVHEERAALTQGLENIDFKQYWEDMGKWSFGHPALRPLPGGKALLAWYAGTPQAMSIHWARVKV